MLRDLTDGLLRIIRRNVKVGRISLADYYAKEQYCLYLLGEVDWQLPVLKYHLISFKSGGHSNV